MRGARTGWSIASAEDLRHYSDFQVIEAGKDAKMYPAQTMRMMHGWLGSRNECAHPSDYFPDLNMTLGYISELVDRVKRLS